MASFGVLRDWLGRGLLPVFTDGWNKADNLEFLVSEMPWWG